MERRIKPFAQQQSEETRRARQTRLYQRNQALGMVLIATVILAFWLYRTNPNWIFPTGRWRL